MATKAKGLGVGSPRTFYPNGNGNRIEAVVSGVAGRSPRKLIQATALAAILVLANCGAFNAASQLRLYLAASGPLIQSLPLPESLKAGLIVDFTDLASGAATMAEDFKACGDDKPCKLNAVDKFQVRFWDIERRGHFGAHEKLQKVKEIIAGIIASARIYYGAQQTVAAGGSAQVVTGNDLKAKLNELKLAMQVP